MLYNPRYSGMNKIYNAQLILLHNILLTNDILLADIFFSSLLRPVYLPLQNISVTIRSYEMLEYSIKFSYARF